MNSGGVIGFIGNPNQENHMNFTTTLLVPQPPDVVFAAITNVRGWWSSAIEGSSDQLGKGFVYRHKDLHRSTQTVTELMPNSRVVWKVSNAEISFVKNKTEWNGTEVVFEISKKGTQTELRFTHVGLSPSCECFNACSEGWGFYVNESLHALITTGRGKGD